MTTALGRESLGESGPRARFIVGSGLMTTASLLTLVAFVLPWASCGGITMSGADFASRGEGLTATVALIPLAATALLALGVGGFIVGLASRSPAPLIAIAVLSFAMSGVSLLAFALFGMRVFLSNEPVRLEYGFFLAGLTQAASAVGSVLCLFSGMTENRRREDSSPSAAWTRRSPAAWSSGVPPGAELRIAAPSGGVSARAAARAAAFCSMCGEPLGPQSSFCSACGARA